jgi:hypothetical protein
MGTQFWELVCDEHGIGGEGEYCGDNDAQLRNHAASTYFTTRTRGRFSIFFQVVPKAILRNYWRDLMQWGKPTGRVRILRKSPPLVNTFSTSPLLAILSAHINNTKTNCAGHNLWSTEAKCDSRWHLHISVETCRMKTAIWPYIIKLPRRYVYRPHKYLCFHLYLQLP